MNLIDEYVDLVSPHLDAPEMFIRASAYHVVSALLGRFCASASAPGLSGLRPNAWMIISSIPARGRRSTVANYSNLVYEHALRKFNEKTLNIGHDEALHRAQESYIESGTQEGIVDHISATDFRAYYINSTEFGTVLQSMITKEHELGLSSLFSKLYYGEEGVYRLSKRSAESDEDSVRYLRRGKYVTMFAGLQEPHLYITQGMLKQGLIRRILLIYADKDDFGRWIPPLSDSRAGLRRRLRNFGNKVYERMCDYNEYSKNRTDPNPLISKTFDFDFHPKATDYINDYSYRLDKQLIHNMSNVNTYRQTLWEHLAKYSMVHAIARNNIKLIDFGNEREAHGIIGIQDVMAAHDFIKNATKHSGQIIGDIGRIDNPVRTETESLERVLNIILENNYISRSNLYRKTNMLSRKLDEVLKTLMEQEKIDIEVIETSGRNKVFYKVKK